MMPTDFAGGTSVSAPSYAAAQSDGVIHFNVGTGLLSTGGASPWEALKWMGPAMVAGAVLYFLIRK